MDREIQQLLTRGVAAMERCAPALEQLAADPVINIESGPPVCPFCETMNPRISTREGDASGPLGEYFFQGHCEHCGNMFYALPKMWLCLKDVEEVRAEIDARAEA